MKVLGWKPLRIAKVALHEYHSAMQDNTTTLGQLIIPSSRCPGPGAAFSLLISLALFAVPPHAHADDTTVAMVDCVAASVDGKPITLRDVSSRLGATRSISADDFANDSRAKDALEMMIVERLIEEEAAARGLSVSDAEVDRYTNEVAARNNMSRSEFENALSLRNTNVEDYRTQVRVDILRSRLLSQLSQEGVPVTEEDVALYLHENPTLTKSGSKVRLRQVTVGFGTRTPDEARARIEEARESLLSGRSFEDVALEYSEGSEASDGGSLGLVAEEDLNPQIFEALLSLDTGAVSPIVSLPDSYRFFRVDERFLEQTDGLDEQLLAEVRRSLSEKKLQAKMQLFFTSEILKLHYVDRKL